MSLPPSNEDAVRKIAASVLSPEAIANMDVIKAQHLVIKAGQTLLINKETRDLGLALFTVAGWLLPENQQDKKEGTVK
jgi:hypothetical protein